MTGDTEDRVVPTEKWQFNGDVAKCFNNMLERSIPGYTDMRDLCYVMGKTFVQPERSVLDLGASRGEALRPFINDNVAERFIGLEVSEPMRNEMNKEFANKPRVIAIDFDLRRLGIDKIEMGRRPNLVLSILTLMFTPIQYRPQIISAVYKMLPEGGAFILVEKVLGNNAQIDELMVNAYYAMKSSNGYSPDDIARKKASLEGVQVPLTADFNISMLRAEGFRKIDCFYRNLNFAGWIAIK